MADPVTLRLPESLLQQAREMAAVTNQSLEAVLIDWLEFAHQHQPSPTHQTETGRVEPQPQGDRPSSDEATGTTASQPPPDSAAGSSAAD